MAEIKWTEEAHRWLRDIFDYIATNNPDAAQKVVAGIYEKAQVLRQSLKLAIDTVLKQMAKSVSCFMGTTASHI